MTLDRTITRLDGLKKQVDYLLSLDVPGSGTAGGGTYNPDTKPGAPSAYDDEFESGTLDAKWTNINCAAGTVDIRTTAVAADTYDLTMFTGMMALQPGRDVAAAAGYEAEAAILRQTVVLAGTCKVLCKVNFGVTTDISALTIGYAGILLSGATGFDDNDYIFSAFRAQNAGGGDIWGNIAFEGEYNIGGAGAVTVGGETPATGAKYLMLTKTTNDFSIWMSDGHSWIAGTDGTGPPEQTSFTFGAGVMVRLSLFSYFVTGVAEPNMFNSICAFDWVRYFPNNTPLCNA